MMRQAFDRAGVRPFQLSHVTRLEDARAHLRNGGADVILLDLSLPDAQGLESLQQMRAAAPHLAIVVTTGLDDEDVAIQALREGAQDYLLKSQVDGALLDRSIRYAIE